MVPPLRLPPEQPVVLSFSGPDALRYLGGQLTQDVRALGEASLPSCVTDAKGRLQYLVAVCRGEETGQLWVTCPAGHAEGLRERLERYLIADDVEVRDETGGWTCLHADSPPDDALPDLVRHRLGPFGEGFDLWWKSGREPDWPVPDPAEIEDRRIEAMLPAWGAELTQGMLPPEAGLDRRAISYSKGCYIGQEVLSRIKSAGRVNRRLAGFEIDGIAAAGDRLATEGREVGRLTSVARPGGSGRRAALGYLSKEAFERLEPGFGILRDGRGSGAHARWIQWA